MQEYRKKFHVSFSFEFSNCLAFHSTLFLSKMARNFLFYCLAHKHSKLICKSLCSKLLVLNTTPTFRSIRYNFKLILCKFVIHKKFSKMTHSCKEMALVNWVSSNTFTLNLHIDHWFRVFRYDILTIVILFWHTSFQTIHIQNGIGFKQTFNIKPLVHLIFPESIQDFEIDHIKFHSWLQIQRAQHPSPHCFLLHSNWKLQLVPVFDWLFHHDRYL